MMMEMWNSSWTTGTTIPQELEHDFHKAFFVDRFLVGTSSAYGRLTA